jgi:hypothetical protein
MASPALATRVESGWRSVRRARHAAALPRYLAIFALALLIASGIRATFFAPHPVPPIQRRRAEADAPSRAFALQFARAYLTYDASRPGRRNRALAPFVLGSLGPGAGFEAPAGEQRVRWLEVASDQPALAGGRLLTIAASVSSQAAPLYLAVSVRHAPGQPLELGGYPALVGAPAIAAPTPIVREAVGDPALTEVVDRVLRNYLSGAARDLRADLSPEAEVTLPTARLRLTELEQLAWLGGPGSGAVLATLSATDPRGATYTLAYELGVTHRERPYVDFIEVVPTAS